MKYAVIGAGVAGLSAAWLLSQNHDVVLLEREDRLGGHANTVEAGPDRVAVDTGFIVYNTACYPNLIALLEHLGVETAPTHMGFSVSLDDGAYEYNGDGLNGFFGQRSNILSARHWHMLRDILRFFREQRNELASETGTLGLWLERRGYSRWFIERHIVPMGAAIWSTPAAQVLDFPVAAFMRFFANHGLLQMSGRPQWRTVRGGSRNYVARLKQTGRFSARAGEAAVAITRSQAGVEIRTARGDTITADGCLIATHADEALALLRDADRHERRMLGSFSYAANEAVLHTDETLMPRRKCVWSSWNYQHGGDETRGVALTYWMNKLQPLPGAQDYFVSINPSGPMASEKVIRRISYTHPLFDKAAIDAQSELWSLQGRNRVWFAGSYFAYGFHECALQSGLAAAEAMGHVRRPWRVAGENDRLKIPARPREAA